MDIPLILIGYYASEHSYIWYLIAILIFVCAMGNSIPKLNPQEKIFMKDLPMGIEEV